MNNAKEKIFEIIKKEGFITVEKFFEIASSYYYQNNNPFGKSGDFITAPEVSQLFGEMMGVFIASNWLSEGKPRISLVEMGAGNGTLMLDVLRATKSIEGFHDAIDKVYIVETSDRLIRIQKDKLKAYSNIEWLKNINEITNDNCYFFCNELFDALPLKQYVSKDGRYYERIIKLKDNKLIFSIPETSENIESTISEDGNVIEISEVSRELSVQIKRISKLALIIDYGYLQTMGKETLQAIKNHKYSDVLSDIGDSDLTYLVNFKLLQNYFDNSQVITQSEFLRMNGIDLRAQILISKGYDKHLMISELDRLLSRDEMGELFKVLIYKSITAMPRDV